MTTSHNATHVKSPALTLEELRFLLNETTASLDNGAEDPLFQQCCDKLRAIIMARSAK